jgi:hypothetical protein
MGFIMRRDVKIYYDEGLCADISKPNPYNRLTQVLRFHAWEAGYFDKHRKSSVPREDAKM